MLRLPLGQARRPQTVQPGGIIEAAAVGIAVGAPGLLEGYRRLLIALHLPAGAQTKKLRIRHQRLAEARGSLQKGVSPQKQ